MSRQHMKQPEKQGPGASAHGSQVAVRDGNLLLCPCCGEVLMELSDGLVDDLEKAAAKPKVPSQFPLDADGLPRPPSKTLDEIIRRQDAAKEAAHRAKRTQAKQPAPPIEPEGPRYQADPIVVPIDPDVAAYAFPEKDPPPPPSRTQARTPKLPLAEPRPKFPRPSLEADRERETERKPRRRERRLRDPWSYRSARLYAWMFYRMQKLNVQLIGEICAKHEEIEQLKCELTGQKMAKTQKVRGPRPSPLERACKVPAETADRYESSGQAEHTHADVSMAPEEMPPTEQRHAPTDLGVAPSESVEQADPAKERGPP